MKFKKKKRFRKKKTPETALRGWKAIADFFGVSERTMQRRKKELEDAGVIMKMTIGSPPNRQKMVTTFPSLLMIWFSKKAAKKETL
jgi:DNA-binding Lrp family transcriptional regulator